MQIFDMFLVNLKNLNFSFGENIVAFSKVIIHRWLALWNFWLHVPAS